jgi:hypothetical protein
VAAVWRYYDYFCIVRKKAWIWKETIVMVKKFEQYYKIRMLLVIRLKDAIKKVRKKCKDFQFSKEMHYKDQGKRIMLGNEDWSNRTEELANRFIEPPIRYKLIDL